MFRKCSQPLLVTKDYANLFIFLTDKLYAMMYQCRKIHRAAVVQFEYISTMIGATWYLRQHRAQSLELVQ